jgi:membrane-associated phospholipid phosphatase
MQANVLLIHCQLLLLWKPALALAVVIALSRLYLYAHWPTDILGGAAVGILAGWLGTKLAQSFPRKKV